MKKYSKHKTSHRPSDRIGFYIALSICLVAVGLAVWSTYTSVGDYLKEKNNEFSASLADEQAPVAKDVEGVIDSGGEGSVAGSGSGSGSGNGESDASAVLETTAETVSETRDSDISLYESSTIPRTDDVDASADMDSLTAVLKVQESMIYPVKSKNVFRQYSETAVYNRTMKDYRAHTGTDFTANKGEDVLSMCDGVVSKVYVSEHYGMTVEVSNADYTVKYCGLDTKTKVKANDQVKQGDVIGTVAVVPCEKDDVSHIHVEVKVLDKYIDPLTVIMSDM